MLEHGLGPIYRFASLARMCTNTAADYSGRGLGRTMRSVVNLFRTLRISLLRLTLRLEREDK